MLTSKWACIAQTVELEVRSVKVYKPHFSKNISLVLSADTKGRQYPGSISDSPYTIHTKSATIAEEIRWSKPMSDR